MEIGADIGGTFTDIVIIDRDNEKLDMFRLPSTPWAPHEGLLEGLRKTGVDLGNVTSFVHGTTTCTNTILEHKGSKAGLITSRGFADLLEIMRTSRAYSYKDLYNLRWQKPEPLVPRYLRLELDERTESTGQISTKVNLDQARSAVQFLRKHNVVSVAIAFLFSFMNSENERTLKEFIEKEHPEMFCSLSSEYPVIREFERSSTAVADAYVKPVMDRYLQLLGNLLKERGLQVDCYIMKSNGGIVTSTSARDRPIEVFLSGPSGGAIMAKFMGEMTGVRNLIGCDMGGTSFDVTLLANGEYAFSRSKYLYPGVPIVAPMIDIVTIGAGGGSIAWLDLGGALKVGPQSAGARPGPACYGAGGEEPTVTDANVVLGRLNPEYFSGGAIKIYPDLAHKAIKRLADKIGRSVLETARGILDISITNMTQAIRVVSIERGHDPKDFALIAFGGAGPLHSGAIARQLGIPKIIVPLYPGAGCALGMTLADIRFDYTKSYPTTVETADLGAIEKTFEEMARSGIEAMKREKYRGEPLILKTAEMRYEGQNWEIPIPMPTEGPYDRQRVMDAFDQEHKRLYGFTVAMRHEVMNLRVSAIGRRPSLDLEKFLKPPHKVGKALKGKRRVFVDEENDFIELEIYERGNLLVGAEIKGPAVLEQMDSTTYMPPRTIARVDKFRNLILDVGA